MIRADSQQGMESVSYLATLASVASTFQGHPKGCNGQLGEAVATVAIVKYEACTMWGIIFSH